MNLLTTNKLTNDSEYIDANERIEILKSLVPSLSFREKFELNQLKYLIAAYDHEIYPTLNSKIDLDKSVVNAIESFYTFMSHHYWHVATGIASTDINDRFIVYTTELIDPIKLKLPDFAADMSVEYIESGPIVTTNPESMKEAGVI